MPSLTRTAGMFTDRWRREGYAGGMQTRPRRRSCPSRPPIQLHLPHAQTSSSEELGVKAEDDEVEELNRAWHRLASMGRLARRPRSACARASSSRRSRTATSTCWSTWPSSVDCPGTVCSRPRSPARSSPSAQCYRRAAELLGCESSRSDDGRRPPGRFARRRQDRACAPPSSPDPMKSGPQLPRRSDARSLFRHRRHRLPRPGGATRALAAHSPP